LFSDCCQTIKTETDRIMALGKATRHSTLAKGELSEIQRKLELPRYKIIADVVTRWTSFMRSLKSVLVNRVALETLMAGNLVLTDDWMDVPDQDPDDYSEIGEQDWLTCEFVLPILEHFAKVTDKLQSSATPTLGLAMPLLAGVLDKIKANEAKLQSIKDRDQRAAAATALKFLGALREQIGTRVDINSVSEKAAWHIASFLHPCFKKLKYLNTKDRKLHVATVHRWTQEELDSLPARVVTASASSSSSSSSSSASPSSAPMEIDSKADGKDATEDKHGVKRKRESEPESRSTKAFDAAAIYAGDDDEDMTPPLTEIQIYDNLSALALSPHPTDKEDFVVPDPLLWWKERESQFPQLSRLARRFLATPASSAPSERTFSASGRIISSLRTLLETTTSKELVLVHRNRHLMPEYQ
jgi:hypothetical protein